MSTTVSDGATDLTALAIEGYESSRAAGNIIHAIIGTPEPAVTLREANLRTGTLTLVIGQDDDLADDFEALLKPGVVLSLASTDRPRVNMSFVVTDDLSLALDTATATVWTVTFGWQEVAV